ncbi:MAG: metallophosphoesterase family protein [Actinomycetota bacterium]
MAIASTARDIIRFASRETGASGPHLVVETDGAAVVGPPFAQPPPTADPVLAAAGDIACDPTGGAAPTEAACHMGATSDVLLALAPTIVAPFGDLQYEDGALFKFQTSYEPTWGRLKAITRPAVGNHEYRTAGAAGYFAYFGAAAGDAPGGYYSYDLGTWHVVVLNSNCGEVGGCGAGSPQLQWLRADLAVNPDQCTLAYWHRPRFSSGKHGGDASLSDTWQALYDAGAEVVLNGHDHDYERFAPQSPNGSRDDARGIREFVVGTGGKSHYPIGNPMANSEARSDDTFGVLALTLRGGGYDWRFVADSGGAPVDSGAGTCH